MQGLVATLLLRPAAADKLLRAAFNGLEPDEGDLSSGADVPAAYYIWGVAADTKVARWAAVELSKRLRFDVFPDLPGYMTAATPAGRRGAVTHLGFRPSAARNENLLISPPIAQRQAA